MARETRVAQLVEQLAARLIGDEWSPGERLPPEREWADALGVSRPTLREALRQLEHMGLLASHHGSGTRVLPWRTSATIEILPLFMKYAAHSLRDLRRMLASALRLRVVPIVEALSWLADVREEVDFDALATEVDRVWAQRVDVAAFVAADFEWIRALIRASRHYPALWVLNAFSPVYRELIERPEFLAPASPVYRETWLAVLDHCRRGDAATAVAAIREYFADVDRRLLERLDSLVPS